MDLREYVHMLGRRSRLIASVLLCILGVNLILTLSADPVYQSQTRLFVSTPDLIRTDPLGAGSFAIQRVNTYVDLANGDELASRVVSQLRLKVSPSAFATKITAAAVPDTVILVISATDSDPRVAQEYSQITAQELIEFVQEIETPAGKQRPAVKVTIVTSTDLPTSPISPRPVRNFVLALLIGLLLGVGAANVWEQIDPNSPSRRLSSRDGESPGRAPSPPLDATFSPGAGTERDRSPL